VRGGRAVLVEANKKLPEWRRAVSDAALLALADHQAVKPFTGPVRVSITFFLAKPAKPKWVIFPASKPDL
jgi:Holliday junction resolvase RusA-like endonuclease